MADELKVAEEANTLTSSAEEKKTKRINRWLGIIEILKEILTWLKH